MSNCEDPKQTEILVIAKNMLLHETIWPRRKEGCSQQIKLWMMAIHEHVEIERLTGRFRFYIRMSSADCKREKNEIAIVSSSLTMLRFPSVITALQIWFSDQLMTYRNMHNWEESTARCCKSRWTQAGHTISSRSFLLRCGFTFLTAVPFLKMHPRTQLKPYFPDGISWRAFFLVCSSLIFKPIPCYHSNIYYAFKNFCARVIFNTCWLFPWWHYG